MAKANKIINMSDSKARNTEKLKHDITSNIFELSNSTADTRTPIEVLIDESQYNAPHMQTIKDYDDNVIMHDQSGLLLIRVRAWVDGRIEATIKSGPLHKFRGNVPVLFDQVFHYTDSYNARNIFSVIRNEVAYRKSELYSMVNVKSVSKQIFEPRTAIVDALDNSASYKHQDYIDNLRSNLKKSQSDREPHYRKVAKVLMENARTISDVSLTSDERLNAIDDLVNLLNDCAKDPDIKDLTDVYRDTEPDTPVSLGYSAKAITKFIMLMNHRFHPTEHAESLNDAPKLKLVDIGEYGYIVDTNELGKLDYAGVDELLTELAAGYVDPVERETFDQHVVDGHSYLKVLFWLKDHLKTPDLYTPVPEFEEVPCMNEEPEYSPEAFKTAYEYVIDKIKEKGLDKKLPNLKIDK